LFRVACVDLSPIGCFSTPFLLWPVYSYTFLAMACSGNVYGFHTVDMLQLGLGFWITYIQWSMRPFPRQLLEAWTVQHCVKLALIVFQSFCILCCSSTLLFPSKLFCLKVKAW
jgi:hypothetical protein